PVVIVSERGRVVRVPVSDVLYLKAELKYVTLRTATHTYVLDDALSDLEHRLGDRFLRVHRNALVARSAVSALERRTMTDGEGDGTDEGGVTGECWAVRVAPVDEWLAVSRRQASAVRDALAASGL
ncbi:MAG: LytTR family DNA-binding domain-containing protein, partial [Pseudomonadota bacterium]|nr:LytTR family DNA-binding domain-containing protein [Pseudomonadota bacterium]